MNPWIIFVGGVVVGAIIGRYGEEIREIIFKTQKSIQKAQKRFSKSIDKAQASQKFGMNLPNINNGNSKKLNNQIGFNLPNFNQTKTRKVRNESNI